MNNLKYFLKELATDPFPMVPNMNRMKYAILKMYRKVWRVAFSSNSLSKIYWLKLFVKYLKTYCKLQINFILHFLKF